MLLAHYIANFYSHPLSEVQCHNDFLHLVLTFDAPGDNSASGTSSSCWSTPATPEVRAVPTCRVHPRTTAHSAVRPPTCPPTRPPACPHARTHARTPARSLGRTQLPPSRPPARAAARPHARTRPPRDSQPPPPCQVTPGPPALPPSAGAVGIAGPPAPPLPVRARHARATPGTGSVRPRAAALPPPDSPSALPPSASSLALPLARLPARNHPHARTRARDAPAWGRGHSRPPALPPARQQAGPPAPALLVRARHPRATPCAPHDYHPPAPPPPAVR